MAASGSSRARSKSVMLSILPPMMRRGAAVGPAIEMAAEERVLRGLGLWRIPPSPFLPEIGKATLTAYRSRGAIMRERWRLVQARKFLIHPYSSFRKYWLFVTAILTVVNIHAVPLAVTFFPEYRLMGPMWLTYSISSDVVFLVDMFFNFFTANMVDNVQSLDSREIKLRYLKTWFILDLLGLLPLDYILIIKYLGTGFDLHDPDTIEMFNIARIMGMLRLFRVSRVLRFVNYLEEVMDFTKWGLTGFMSVIYTFLVMCSVLHWTSCFSFLVQKITGFQASGWVRDMQIVNATIPHQYIGSLFRTMSHMLSVAYATINHPKGPAELWLTCLSLLIGTALYFSILSRITALVYGTYSTKRLYKSKYDQCELYMANRHIPNHLQTRIRNHLYLRFQGKWFDEEEILRDMSESLRQEVMYYNCNHIVTKVPWFKDLNVINAVIQLLKFEVFQSTDVIFRKGAIGRKMYMIDVGVVSLDNEGLIQKISEGTFFGEACLIGVTIRTATAIALTPCKLYSFSVENFKSVVDQYPDLKKEIESATERVH